MKRTFCSTAIAAAFAFGGAAFADQGQQQSQSSMTDPVEKQTFSALDRDNDGTLSMMEAAADPDAKQRFKEIDANNDYQLSRSEYETLEKAAAGGSTQGAQQEQDKSWVEKSKQTYEERSK